MNIVVNGERRDVADDLTVDVLATSVIDRPKGVAVALNGEDVPRSEWSTTRVRADYEVEVVTAKQGG
jgi:sulfur carrier protein